MEIRNNLALKLFLIVSVFGIAYVHSRIGYGYSLYIFYLIPITLSAWRETYSVIAITFFTSILMWSYIDFNVANENKYTIPYILDMGLKLTLFSMVCLLVVKFRKDLNDMTEMAMTDPLTNLDNLRSFKIKYLQVQKLSNNNHAVLLIDLDNFKKANDTFGHNEGNNILVKFSEMLTKTTRSSDVIARIGGDEFVILLKNTDKDGANKYVNRLRESFKLSGLKEMFGINFSIGVSIYNDLPKNISDVLSESDFLMYKAKLASKLEENIENSQ